MKNERNVSKKEMKRMTVHTYLLGEVVKNKNKKHLNR